MGFFTGKSHFRNICKCFREAQIRVLHWWGWKNEKDGWRRGEEAGGGHIGTGRTDVKENEGTNRWLDRYTGR